MNYICLFILLVPGFLFSQNDDNWILKAESLDNYHAPTMANGMIGLLASATPLQVEQILLNGVFDQYGGDNVQSILAGINFANITIKTPDLSSSRKSGTNNWRQELNMKKAVLTTYFNMGEELSVKHDMYALRHLPFSALSVIEIEAKEDVEIEVYNSHEIGKPLKEGDAEFKTITRRHVKIPILTTSSKSPKNKHVISASSGFIFENDNLNIMYNEWYGKDFQQYFSTKLKKGDKFIFALVGSIVSTVDVQDPVNEAERQCIFAMLEGKDKLIKNHIKAWEDIWQSDIEIEGDDQSQKDVRFSLFNLYSFIREKSSYSIPPMGLTNLDYYGHIFWDAELWMFPPILALKPEMAKSMIDYRLKNLGAAQKKAEIYGYDGAMFPWESDDLGEESTPTWALTGPFEHHITAVVGNALWDYYSVTQDTIWLKEEAYECLENIADFWISRSTRDEQGKYHILNVVGADEFAENVDNNAFTNGAVIKILNSVVEASGILEIQANPLWKRVADNIVIEKFKNGVVKNYRGYDGQKTKQADVNLLSYPLEIIDDKDIILKNLEYYQKKVISDGPAMTHSIYSIIYSRLGMKQKAWELFKKAYRLNQRPPYGVLAEGAYDNNPYFATAAGGMLQSVLFGFCGVEITNEGLVFNEPQLPSHWKSLTIKGFGTKNKTLKIVNE